MGVTPRIPSSSDAHEDVTIQISIVSPLSSQGVSLNMCKLLIYFRPLSHAWSGVINLAHMLISVDSVGAQVVNV